VRCRLTVDYQTRGGIASVEFEFDRFSDAMAFLEVARKDGFMHGGACYYSIVSTKLETLK
jgi:hypothetical protein